MAFHHQLHTLIAMNRPFWSFSQRKKRRRMQELERRKRFSKVHHENTVLMSRRLGLAKVLAKRWTWNIKRIFAKYEGKRPLWPYENTCWTASNIEDSRNGSNGKDVEKRRNWMTFEWKEMFLENVEMKKFYAPQRSLIQIHQMETALHRKV